jgi:hypothetical protein
LEAAVDSSVNFSTWKRGTKYSSTIEMVDAFKLDDNIFIHSANNQM